MVKLEFLLSIIVGLAIFLTDLIFGWLTFLTTPIPVIFIIAIIIGLFAGTHGGAVFATMITWIGGIIIGVLIAPIVFVGHINPDQNIVILIIFVFLYSVRGFYTLTYEGNIFELLVLGIAALIVMLIITPILYLFSFAFAPIGVVIGKFIRGRFGGRSPKPKPVIQDTPVVEEPAEVEESFEPEESLETDEEPEESLETDEEFSDTAEN